MQLLGVDFHMSWRGSCSVYVSIILLVHLARCKIFLEIWSLAQSKLCDAKASLKHLENCNWSQE